MPVQAPTRKLEAARREISETLRRYHLNWEDVAPDIDDKIWKNIASFAKKIRKTLFQREYPYLYDKDKSRQRGKD